MIAVARGRWDSTESGGAAGTAGAAALDEDIPPLPSRNKTASAAALPQEAAQIMFFIPHLIMVSSFFFTFFGFPGSSKTTAYRKQGW
ncbi:MAG: hypothetical protein LBU23_06725 [Planctomycetota bacterium]|jgi:hypothetical protein|nr:hypothetical protein [Planctomycetota bacterium]